MERFTKEELEKWWHAQCPKCGWDGLSRDCAGGEPIADTGDFNDPLCPMCIKKDDCVVVDDYVEPDAQAAIAALQKEIATRDSTDSILATRIRELEARLTQRTAELEAAKTRAHESESKATEFSVKLQQAREERDNLRLRIQAVDKEHEQLAVDRQKMTGTVESLLTERDNLRAELERVRGERDRHRNVTKAC